MKRPAYLYLAIKIKVANDSKISSKATMMLTRRKRTKNSHPSTIKKLHHNK